MLPRFFGIFAKAHIILRCILVANAAGIAIYPDKIREIPAYDASMDGIWKINIGCRAHEGSSFVGMNASEIIHVANFRARTQPDHQIITVTRHEDLLEIKISKIDHDRLVEKLELHGRFDTATSANLLTGTILKFRHTDPGAADPERDDQIGMSQTDWLQVRCDAKMQRLEPPQATTSARKSG